MLSNFLGQLVSLRERLFLGAPYALGALRAVRFLRGRRPGLYGIEDVLGMK